MSPLLLRQLWQMIEKLPQQTLARLDDSGLVGWVVVQLEQCRPLRAEERQAVEGYLHDHTMLIRDMAGS